MKEPKKVVSYRIRETTIEKVKRDAEAAGLTINTYVDEKLSKVANGKTKK